MYIGEQTNHLKTFYLNQKVLKCWPAEHDKT